MRTTLNIEDDVLAAAKEMASRQRLSAGQLISRLLREAMSGTQRAARRSGRLMRALLDANVLIALFDAGHTMHARAMAWLENQASGASGAAPGTGHL
jgi:hypothetical protein